MNEIINVSKYYRHCKKLANRKPAKLENYFQVTFDIASPFWDDIERCEIWIRENIKGKVFSWNNCYWFESKDEALWFKITWS